MNRIILMMLLVVWANTVNAESSQLPHGYVSQGGLTWMPTLSSELTWPDANAYCTNTAINGKTGWRLPTIDELRALYASGAMNGQGWTLYYTWSSTPGSAGGHYNVSLGDGSVSVSSDTRENNVACVRHAGDIKKPSALSSNPAQVNTSTTSHPPIGLKASPSAADKAARAASEAASKAKKKSDAEAELNWQAQQLAKKEAWKKEEDERQARREAENKLYTCEFTSSYGASSGSEADARAQAEHWARSVGPGTRFVSLSTTCQYDKSGFIPEYHCGGRATYAHDNVRGGCGSGSSATSTGTSK